MRKEHYALLTLTLCVTAAGLALAAVIVQYVRHQHLNVALLAAALFLLAFGIGAKGRIAP